MGFGDDGRTVLIEHEAIPRFMSAMVMPFNVDSRAQLADFDNGDAVGFTLYVNRDSSWIADLRALPDSAVARHPAGTPDPFLEGEDTLLERGNMIPDTPLVDQENQAFNLADFRGRALLLTFIYTRCPLPDFCPLLSRQFKTLQPVLQEQFGEQVHLLSISFDPTYDTPQTLRAYAQRYTQVTSTWTFATGTEENIEALANQFGVFYSTADGANFDHNLTTALIDQDGRIVQLWRGNDWSSDEVLEAVTEMFAESAQ